MLRDRIIQQLSDQLGQLFTSISGGDDAAGVDARNELQKSVQSVVQNVFSKLDLVTRDAAAYAAHNAGKRAFDLFRMNAIEPFLIRAGKQEPFAN